MRRRLLLFVVLTVLTLSCSPFVCSRSAFAEETLSDQSVGVPAVVGEKYRCGESFELIVKQVPSWVDYIGRRKGREAYESMIKPDERFVLMRISVRNTSMNTIPGLTPESFSLSGTLLGKTKTVVPAVIQEVNFRFMNLGDQSSQYKLGEIVSTRYTNAIKQGWADLSDLYVSPDVSYTFFNIPFPSDIRPHTFKQLEMLPLRVWDLYVAFDAYPGLSDWTFAFEPIQTLTGTNWETGEPYPEAFPACSLVLSIPKITEGLGIPEE